MLLLKILHMSLSPQAEENFFKHSSAAAFVVRG